jgi:hypothetical protein
MLYQWPLLAMMEENQPLKYIKLDANATMSIEEENEEKAGEVQLVRAEGLALVLDTPKGTYTPPHHFTHSENDREPGRGVFAGRDIPGGTILEICPVLILDPQENEEHVRKTDLYNYT